MIDREKLIKVTNRDNGVVGYTVPDLGITRAYQPSETKTIPFKEIESLSFTRGGMNIIRNYLIIRDEEARKAILPRVEPEYNYGKKEVIQILINGSLDALLDCLDFAPQGVLDLVKEEAVNLELNDFYKREAIRQKLNFDVTKAIEIKNTKYDDGSDANSQEEKKAKRRVPIGEQAVAAPSGRRTSPIVENPVDWRDVIKAKENN